MQSGLAAAKVALFSRITHGIAGRCGTKFCSAFVVPQRVAPEAVRRVWVPDKAPCFDEDDGVLDVYQVLRAD
jgi:hypothetical protein